MSGFHACGLERLTPSSTHLLVSNITIRWPSARFEHGLSPSLLRTCALMYEEASPILYRHNVFDFGHPSDVTVFCSLMDAHNAKQITEATFRIQDRDFKKVWDPYLMSMDTSRSFMFDLPNLRHLLVVLQGSWWNFHLGPDDNLKEWPRNDVLRNLSRTLETIHRADVQLMCRVRVPQDHFDLLRRNYATDPMDEENSVLRCVGSTRLQTPARSVYSLSCVLELLSPADIPLY